MKKLDKSNKISQLLTEGVLSDDGLLSLQLLGLSLLVDGLHPELVGLAFRQARHVRLAVLCGTAWDPCSWWKKFVISTMVILNGIRILQWLRPSGYQKLPHPE